MRSRYFLTILAVLLVVTLGSVALHSVFLKQERLRFIDQQVRETAAALVDSELADLRMIDFEKAENIISEELGESRIGKFFVIRNAKGEKVFESAGARVLAIPLSAQGDRWATLHVSGKFIRILNLQLPRLPDRTLQVGLVVDNALLSPEYLSQATTGFLLVALAAGLVASLFLTSFLLRPISDLGGFISSLCENIRAQPVLPKIPASMIGKRASGSSRDEFQRMAFGLNALIDKVNLNYRFSRFWACQMAHELKTPLSVLSIELERFQREGASRPPDISAAQAEVQKISETINSFLGWAELENSSRQKRLYAVRVGDVLESLRKRLLPGEENRLIVENRADVTVVASPLHLEQAISNLVVNALAYSDPLSPVQAVVDSDRVLIVDQGPGIPREVLERLGEPFNRGDSLSGARPGHGLGLAWVKSVARLYDWRFDVRTEGAGTQVQLTFSSPL